MAFGGPPASMFPGTGPPAFGAPGGVALPAFPSTTSAFGGAPSSSGFAPPAGTAFGAAAPPAFAPSAFAPSGAAAGGGAAPGFGGAPAAPAPASFATAAPAPFAPAPAPSAAPPPLSLAPAAPPPASAVAPAGMPPVTSFFGITVAGRATSASFAAASPDKLVTEIPSPGTAADVCIFPLPGVSLPPDRGVVVYWNAPPSAEWSALGALTAGAPSAVFHTGWPALPEVASAPVVRLGLSIEPLAAVSNVGAARARDAWDRLAYAQLVARDLFNFLSSFAQVTPAGERLVIPTDALDRWLRKFEARFRADPSFLTKGDKG